MSASSSSTIAGQSDSTREAAIRLSVVIPTHNPRADHLGAALEALQRQSLSAAEWELIVVDNGSEAALSLRPDVTLPRQTRIVVEPSLGLTSARIAGFAAAQGALIVLVDDDNVLASDYLAEALRIAERHPHLGAWSGAVAARYERPDLAPPESLSSLLTLRAIRHPAWSNDPDHHGSTPWGAGMCVRATVARQYMTELAAHPERRRLDLQGSTLLYSGDTDIAYTACRMGLGKGVFPSLRVEHLIPASRCQARYLCRVAEGRGYSEVFHTYLLTGRAPPRPGSRLDWLRRFRRRLQISDLEAKVSVARDRGRWRAFRELTAVLSR